MRLIDVKEFETLSPFFKSAKGSRFAEWIMRMCSIDKVNYVYNHSKDYTGAEFAARLLNDLGVNYIIGNAERLELLPKGAFITVSNHPYGGLDGIIMIDLMAGIRPDYKFMVNRVLSMVKTMNENFIKVTPMETKEHRVNYTSIKGIRETFIHLQEGHPIGFFPAGAVSVFSLKEMRVRDREWQKSIVSLIHSAKVPIVPIRFFDKNSLFFYSLGLINWRIRLLRMPCELFNKHEQKPRIGIGKIISVEEQEQFADARSLGKFLRKAVYEMPMPTSFVPRTILNFPEIQPKIKSV